jgi:hypothetical protein
VIARVVGSVPQSVVGSVPQSVVRIRSDAFTAGQTERSIGSSLKDVHCITESVNDGLYHRATF